MYHQCIYCYAVCKGVNNITNKISSLCMYQAI